uniref:Glutamate decarboxylase n=1 Tax=Oryza glaberrima TaxID=4538 RepID=I1QJD1_ORYGL
MVLSHASSGRDDAVRCTFATRYACETLPRFRMPEQSIPREAAYQIINDELMLDGNPRLNLASFVTTWMEPECDKLIMDSVNKNYVDMDEYPVTTELQNRCVNMIAHLFNAPIKEDETAIGVGTVGSSEAIMLAGLAFKRKWQNKRKEQGKPCDKPNIVTGANVQVCWEKFARYFEVELKEVKLSEGYYVMDPVKAVEMVDENTICVAAILGSTLTGEFEDVKLLNNLLTEKNKETGWDVPIHVDAASGGFIAPFLYPELEWDFRLPLVKSINVSGHKYGLVYPGVGWVIWRSKEDLPEELIFHINYLGTDQPTFTLNFSKGIQEHHAELHGEHSNTKGRHRGDWSIRNPLQGGRCALGGVLAQGQRQVHRVRHLREPEEVRLDRAGVHHAGQRRARRRPPRRHQGGLQPEPRRAARLGHRQDPARAGRPFGPGAEDLQRHREAAIGRRRRGHQEERPGDREGDLRVLEGPGEEEADRNLLVWLCEKCLNNVACSICAWDGRIGWD